MSTRSTSERPSLHGIPGLMTMGIGRDDDSTKEGGFKFGVGIDGKFVAFDKMKGAPTMTRSDAELEELVRSKRLGSLVPSEFEVTNALPEAVQLVGQKLTFKAYFNEAVTESPSEAYRTRSVIVRYFLEDDTVEMHEPKGPHTTGMPSGRFLKRMQHPSVSLDTLMVGGTIDVYGRCMKIYQCDEFTRNFYASKGVEQAPNGDMPLDEFTKKHLLITPDFESDHMGKTMNSLKRYMESRLGAPTMKMDSKTMFLKYGSQRLSFAALWKDERAFGEMHKFNVAYFLATQEVQIVEVKDSNAQVIFPLLLKRQRLGKKVMIYDDRRSSCEDGDGGEDYVDVDDFRVGNVLDVYGREFLLYDCDDVTQKWYLKNRGLNQKANVVDISVPVPKKPLLPPPPPTGFGSEEDSLQSWKYLVPKPLKADLLKFKNATGNTLKFQAFLQTEDEVERTRKFRITWYLDDDTLAVYEPPQRNSGIVGGAWAARARRRNPGTGEYFKVNEFFVGATVIVNSHCLEITEADDFSLRHMEKQTSLWPQSSIEFVLSNLKKKLMDQSRSMRKMFRKFDEDHSQTISLEEFRAMLDYYGMGVTKAEVITIFRAFDKTGSGMLSYEEFMEAFTDPDEEGGVRSHAVRVDMAGAMTHEDILEYEARAKAAADDEAAETYKQQLLNRVAIAFRNSKAASVLYQKFREFDENKDNTVDRREFAAAMGSGMFHLTEDDVTLLTDVFFKEGVEDIDYEDFIKVITAHADKLIRSS